MIERVEIKNFQSHNDTSLSLHRGLNVIVGDSDKGKSAVLRSLYWVLTNRPSGVSVISDWARDAKGKLTDTASVKLVLSDAEIERIRTADFNGYKVNGTELEAVGVSVPAEVDAAANIADVNIQRQLDAPFMLGLSAGEVARYLNRTIKLDEMDACMSIADSRRKESLKQHKAVESDINSINAKLTELDFVDRAQQIIKDIEVLSQKLKVMQQEEQDMTESLEHRASLKSRLREYAWIEDAEHTLESIKSISAKIDELDESVLSMRRTLNQHQDSRLVVDSSAAIEDAELLLSQVTAATAELDKIDKQCVLITSSIHTYNTLKQTISSTEYIEDAELLLSRVSKLSTMSESLTAQISELDDQLRKHKSASTMMLDADSDIERLKQQIPDVCPSCNQPIGDKDAIHSHS